MDALKKINWKQPKYMIPLIIYFPLLFVGYFVIDLFHTEKAEIPDGLTTTEYLNPDLPDAKMKGDGIGNKYESMIQSTQMKNVNRWKPRKPRNSLRCKGSYRRAHRKARKSPKATIRQKMID